MVSMAPEMPEIWGFLTILEYPKEYKERAKPNAKLMLPIVHS
jgi:hypothetical protein